MSSSVTAALRRTKGSLQRRQPHTRARAVATFAEVPGTQVELIELPGGSSGYGAEPVVEPAEYLDRFDLALPEKFRHWQPVVATVPDARITTAGAGIVDNRGLLVKQSLWDEEHYRRSFRRRVPADRNVHRTSATSVCTLWDDNYYHWLIDALPRLGVLEAAGRKITDLPVVVPAQLTGFQAQSLSALGISPEQHIPFDQTSLRLQEVVWASPAAPIGYCSPFTPAWLRSKFVAPGTAATRRVYISRKVRKVANEEELRPILERFDFEIVSPEGMSFLDQAALFASAEMIIGAHGAGMANAAFGSNQKVLELFQPSYINTCTSAVARAAGHRYWAVVGERTGSTPDAKNFDIHIRADVFETAIRSMVNTELTI